MKKNSNIFGLNFEQERSSNCVNGRYNKEQKLWVSEMPVCADGTITYVTTQYPSHHAETTYYQSGPSNQTDSQSDVTVAQDSMLDPNND